MKAPAPSRRISITIQRGDRQARLCGWSSRAEIARGSRLIDETSLTGHVQGLEPIRNPELIDHMAHVHLYGDLRDVQLACDFFVTKAGAEMV
jgi:hypothetical protein